MLKIRECRKKAGLSGVELAKRIGVTSAAISKWESNDRNPTPEMIVKLAGALGTTPNDLLGVEEKEGE